MPEISDPPPFAPSPEWIEDCLFWRGEVLLGRQAHWCFEYDGLPVDETCPEWPCHCAWAEPGEAADAS
jgi:hypothetical protein